MVKAMLLRVGIDKGSGGSLAPIFTDGTFEYIPIPEARDTTSGRTYSMIVGRCGRPISDFVRAKLKDAVPHYDPEFKTFTYGDPTRNKRRQLLQLEPGDLLVFYAGLEPDTTLDRARIHVIGYFEIDEVFNLDGISSKQYPTLRKRIGQNAHLYRVVPDKDLVVVKGTASGSRLLGKSVPLGDGENKILRDIRSLGYEGSLVRANGHWIRGRNAVTALKKWLKQGPATLIEPGARMFSYVITHDTGFAPNPFGGYLTLACCKPRIRTTAQIGDWVVGMCPARIDSRRVTFTMRVNEVLSFREYFRDKRFQYKKPNAMFTGDNIYDRAKTGVAGQLQNPFHDSQHKDHDTSADRVLLGSIFWYFGKNAMSPPERLADRIAHPFVGHKVIQDTDIIRSYVRWLSINYRIGIHGNPRDSRDGPSESTRRCPPVRRHCG